MTCGEGTRTRSRDIVQDTENGGAACEDEYEEESCTETDQCPGFFLIREPIQHNLQEKMDIEIYLNLETPPHTKKKELGHPKSIILMFILSETENPPEPTTATSSTKTTSSTSSLKTTISTSLWLALAIFRGVLT